MTSLVTKTFLVALVGVVLAGAACNPTVDLGEHNGTSGAAGAAGAGETGGTSGAAGAGETGGTSGAAGADDAGGTAGTAGSTPIFVASSIELFEYKSSLSFYAEAPVLLRLN